MGFKGEAICFKDYSCIAVYDMQLYDFQRGKSYKIVSEEDQKLYITVDDKPVLDVSSDDFSEHFIRVPTLEGMLTDGEDLSKDPSVWSPPVSLNKNLLKTFGIMYN